MQLTDHPLVRAALLSLAGLALLVGCGTAPVAATPPPKLLVFMVVDGLPMRQVTGYRDQLAPDGFKRFLDRGAWFADAHYGHGHTVTAAGHAVMLTGAYPHRTGIISNEWRNPNTGAPVYCTGDEAHQYLENKTAPLAGTSPRNLRAETVGDVLRGARPGAKVIAISGKDRGAILPAGKLGTAYMYMGESGQFASSSYYMPAHPQWVKTFNAAKPADAYFKQSWTALLPEAAYTRSVPDGKAWQVNSGNGNRLPALIGDKHEKPGPLFYSNLLATPFADALTLAFARAAIEGEALGQDDVPDILSVSLSSHDYVNHAFGPESRLSHDHILQLDQHLQAFFRYLDAKVGAGNYVAVLTADHGFVDTPEWSASKGLDAGRLNPSQTLAWLNTGLSRKFGDGKWALGWSGGGILLDGKLIAAKKLNPAAVDKEAKTLLLQVDGIADVFTREQLLSAPKPAASRQAPQGSQASSGAAQRLLESQDVSTPHLAAMRKSWHPDIASSLQVVVKPNWLISSRVGGSSHGTPHAYDTHVPILSYGPRWIGQGQVNTRVEVADIAPTLSRLLGLRVPAQSEGRPLPLPATAR
ncbi:MAG: alkaline phosphatase family protein [Burkholderiaceae bacterium]|nr:alkaline phosphatase family protein [Burkholderiaceae bacterium]